MEVFMRAFLILSKAVFGNYVMWYFLLNDRT